MEIYNLPEDVKVFGSPVKNFPAGIGEAFESLIKTIPGGFDRPFYGFTYMDENGKLIYIAAAQEKYESEAEKYNYERYTIEKGEYLGIALYDWRTKTNSIKDICCELVQDGRTDKTKPCVECYKNDHEMICMIQTIHQR